FSSFESVPHTEVDILGTAGRIHLDIPYLNKVGLTSHIRTWRVGASRAQGTFSDAASLDEETIAFDLVNGYQHEIEAMAASILDGANAVVPLSDSRANVAALVALTLSAREGRSIPMQSVQT